MPEVCTYGDPTGFSSGFATLPAEVGDQLRVTRAVLGALTSIAWAVRVRFDQMGRIERLAGHEQIGGGMFLNADRTLQILYLGSGFNNIGNVPSTDPVPALAAGLDVWLKATLVFATALCTYEYSYADVIDVDQVPPWLPIGTPVIGNHAGVAPILNQSDVVVIGSNSTLNSSMGGRLYAFAEYDSGVKDVEINGTDWPDNTASSFVSTSGDTVDIIRTGDPATEITHAGGLRYGDGHYGLCGRRNVRGCRPARASATPLTTTTPFDPSCHDQEPC